LEGFGISPKSQSIGVAGALLHYLNETQHHQKSHIQRLTRLDRDDHLWMDAFTFKSLELFHPLNPGGHALISIIDQTLTPMGARTLKQWIARPLTRIEPLLHRHERVAFFKANKSVRSQIQEHLKKISDLERIGMRIATKRIGPKELKTLELTIKHCIALQALLKEHELELSFNENTIQQVALTIQTNLKEEVPAVAAKGGMIASGINERLDAYRALAYESESALDEMLQEQIKQTGLAL
jgi:DNA mismatch repair protein MutS